MTFSGQISGQIFFRSAFESIATTLRIYYKPTTTFSDSTAFVLYSTSARFVDHQVFDGATNQSCATGLHIDSVSATNLSNITTNVCDSGLDTYERYRNQ
jgi:hypothetical protein